MYKGSDGRWHGVTCLKCGGLLYSSLPRHSSTPRWWHVNNTDCTEPTPEPTPPDSYTLSYNDGKAVQEILNRYVGEELAPRLTLSKENTVCAMDEDQTANVQRDIDYITGLAKLFD